MPIRALVTGCNGFVGRHLSALLLEEGVALLGLDTHVAAFDPRIDYSRADIGDSPSLRALLGSMEADEIYHLAAIASPRICQGEPGRATRVNVMGSAELFEYVRSGSGRRLLVVGSSEEYARGEADDLTYRETDPLDPHNIYGATKIGAEILGRAYAEQFGLPIFFTRSFNHTGAGQSEEYVVSNFAKQCAEIYLGNRPPTIEVGNIDVERDFSDVRDVVRAYSAIIRGGKPGEAYNVGSGTAVSLRSILGRLIGMTGKKEVRIAVRPDIVRARDARSIKGDISKLRGSLGWEPSRGIEETLRWVFEHWVAVLRSGPSN